MRSIQDRNWYLFTSWRGGDRSLGGPTLKQLGREVGISAGRAREIVDRLRQKHFWIYRRFVLLEELRQPRIHICRHDMGRYWMHFRGHQEWTPEQQAQEIEYEKRQQGRRPPIAHVPKDVSRETT